MKKLIYLLMAVLMVLAAVSCKKDDKTGDSEPEIPVPEEAVDLGIVMTREDGTTYKLYWAKSNLCETGFCATPEDYGDYYAWGELEPYYAEGHIQDSPCENWRVREDHPITGYNLGSNKFRISGDDADNVIFSRYNTKEIYGQVDDITELQRGEKSGEPVDDVARAKLGGKWRMPTAAEWDALRALSWIWTPQNGVNGRLISADNGNSIFLPAAGCRLNATRGDVNSNGYYWSSSLKTDNPVCAWYMRFYNAHVYEPLGVSRALGCSIRPVWEE